MLIQQGGRGIVSQSALCTCAMNRSADNAIHDTDSRWEPEVELPPSCRGVKVAVGMEVPLGLVIVGVVPFDGHLTCALWSAMDETVLSESA